LPWTNYGRDKLWLIGCLGLSPDCLIRKLVVCDLSGAYVNQLCLGGCGWRPCPDFASKTLTFALQLRKIMENLSQYNQRAPALSALNVFHLVDFAIAGDWPCRPWVSHQATGSTLSLRNSLPSCRTRGFPTSANFESKLSGL